MTNVNLIINIVQGSGSVEVFSREPITNNWLSLGSTINTKTYTVIQGTELKIQATPSNGNTFDKYISNNGIILTTNPLIVTQNWNGSANTYFISAIPEANEIVVTYPSASGIWRQQGGTLAIAWNKTGSGIGGTVKIELIKSSDNSVTLVIAASVTNSGTYSWVIPATVPLNYYKIKITKVGTTYTDTSDNRFRIIANNALTVLWPNIPGTVWAKATTQMLYWASPGSAAGGDVKIELMKAGVLNSVIIATTPNVSPWSYAWTIPNVDTIPVASDYRIKISKLVVTGVNNTSENNFSITAAVGNAPVVGFTSAIDANNPKSVTFTDTSTNTPTTWDWNFGDNSTHGTTQNPTHVYADDGTYSVTLVATNSFGNNSVSHDVVISTPSQGGGIDWTLGLIFGGLIGGALILAFLLGNNQGQQQPQTAASRRAAREQEITEIERQKLSRQQFEEQQQRVERERAARVELERKQEEERIEVAKKESQLEAERLKKLQS